MLVSTIIPTYNRAKDVVFAIESALRQTYASQEILVVDDGSKDDTAAVVSTRYGDKVRYLRKPNGGVSSARNHGIAEAHGDAIAFLDSDDEWLPDKLTAQVEVLRARPRCALVMTSIMVMDEDRKDVAPFSRRTTIPADGHVLEYVMKSPAMTPSTVMVRTNVAREIGGFDTSLRTAEDLDFHLKVALHHEEAVVDRPLVRYARYEGSLGSQLRTYHDYVLVMERFVREHAGELDPELARDALVRAYLKNATGLANHGEIVGALRMGVRAIPRMRRSADALALGRLGAALGRAAGSRTLQRFR